MAKNQNLNSARTAKEDEFYTQLEDIEAEVKHYKEHFKGKVVLCNCDEPRISNFTRYFVLNFNLLGLKKLICTCYKSQNADLFSQENSEQAVYLEYYGTTERNPDISKLEFKPLKGDGDFRSPECIEFLKEADIVCTNPPFSLLYEFVLTLLKYKKKFLIIGNLNAINYKEIFPYVMNNELWLGYRNVSSGMSFRVPDYYTPRETRFWIDETGQKWRSMGNACWITNMEHSRRNKPLELYKKYNPEDYPKYDNYDAIEVSKVNEIPYDYFGLMGVPITFIDKYCPTQFTIVGIMTSHGKEPKGIPNESAYLNGKWLFARYLIIRK